MNRKTILLLAFLLMALVQLYVPAKMIWSKETVISQGQNFKFKTRPVDPNDPFRGKYIRLNFEADQYKLEDLETWEAGQDAYVYLTTNELDLATIEIVSPSRIGTLPNFIIAKTRYINEQDSTLYIDYPFDRFYMEESKAYEAELAYRAMQSDSSTLAYALVSVKNGEAVLKDVLINHQPIKEVVEERLEKAVNDDQ